MRPDRSGPLLPLLLVTARVINSAVLPGAAVATSFLKCTVGWFVPEPSVPSLWDPWILFWVPLRVLSHGIVFMPISCRSSCPAQPPSGGLGLTLLSTWSVSAHRGRPWVVRRGPVGSEMHGRRPRDFSLFLLFSVVVTRQNKSFNDC